MLEDSTPLDKEAKEKEHIEQITKRIEEISEEDIQLIRYLRDVSIPMIDENWMEGLKKWGDHIYKTAQLFAFEARIEKELGGMMDNFMNKYSSCHEGIPPFPGVESTEQIIKGYLGWKSLYMLVLTYFLHPSDVDVFLKLKSLSTRLSQSLPNNEELIKILSGESNTTNTKLQIETLRVMEILGIEEVLVALPQLEPILVGVREELIQCVLKKSEPMKKRLHSPFENIDESKNLTDVVNKAWQVMIQNMAFMGFSFSDTTNDSH